MITIKHLIIFKEVARVKSMSLAAKNLYISQPTISQKISEIEKYYHIKLFQRNSKTLGISEEGQIFLDHCNTVLSELDKIDEIFFFHRNNITIRVGSTLTVGSTVTSPLLQDIQLKYPHFNLQVYIDNTQSIEDMLLNNQLDIAIVEGDIHSDMVHHEPIIADRLGIVCSKNHPLSKYKQIPITKIYHESFITREKGSGTRAMLEQFMSVNKVPYHIKWQCHSWESVKQAVIYNHGLTLISLSLIKKELQDNLLHLLQIDDWKWERHFSLCYHKNKAWNQNLELFKNEVLRFSKNFDSFK